MATLSLVDLLRNRADKMPDSRAYTFLSGGKESDILSFSQLDRRARAIGARLQQLGAVGERALLLYPAGTEYISAFYGCVAGGAVAVPGYPPRMNRNLHRLEAIMDDAQPKVALTTDAVFRQIRDRFDEAPALAKLQWLITDQLPLEVGDDWVDPNASLDTIAFLQYTSASTSVPKGVMVSHGNVLHNQVLMKEAVQHGPETVAVSWLPLFHDMGLISVVLATLYNGVPCYLVSPVDFLKKPRLWLEAITRYKGTFSGAPNFGFQLCIDRIGPKEREGLDLSSWRVAFNGSEPVRAKTLSNFAAAFASCGFRSEAMFPCYGLAENTLFAAGKFYRGPRAFSATSLEANQPRAGEDGRQAELVSCGVSLLDSRLVIANPETRRRCGEGEIGEIWLASPSVAHGYWGKRELSEATFRARLDDGDGPFLRTGDLGFVNQDEVYVTGRIKDLIIVRGRNLIPQDIEQTVEECDLSIRPGFVAAVSTEVDHQERLVIVAEIRREARRELDTDALVERIRAVVAAEYAVEVSGVALLRPGGLPKTTSGKTQRAMVVRDFLAGELRPQVEWRDDAVFAKPELPAAPAHRRGRGLERLEPWLVARLATLAKLPPERILPDQSILDFGLDSVALVGLVAELEAAFGLELEVERFFEGQPTVRQFVARVQREGTTPDVSPVVDSQPVVAAPAVKAVAAAAAAVAVPSTHAEPKSPSWPRPVTRPVMSLPLRPAPVAVASQPPKTNGSRPMRSHPYQACVNPELGRVLSQMGMDKTFVRGEGSWLWDQEGRRYLDFLAQYGSLPFGFNAPRIWAALNAVRDSAEPSFVQPSYLDAAGQLAKRLLAAAPPGMAYVTFANSGAEAVEAAIKLCRSTTGRRRILAASNGFHGKTLGALSATDKEKYQKPFGAPEAGFDYVPYGDGAALARMLADRQHAGFLVEPIQGEGGIVEPPAGYLRLARKICRETGTLFVADEIQTGLGRTGAMFSCRELGITPDVMTVAKALGGGLIPIGACMSTAAAYNEEFALRHTSTFAGNTLSCRVGLATLDLLEENGGALISRVAANGARLKAELGQLACRHPGVIGEVRGRGYLLGLRFGVDRHSWSGGLLGYLGEQEALTALVVSHLLEVEGVRVGYTLNQGGVLRIEPPLTATWEECQFFLDALERVLCRIEQGDLATLTTQITGFDASTAQESGLTAVEPTRVEATVAARQPALRRAESRQREGRFAFLVHPLAWKDYADLDGSLSPLSEPQLAALSTALADNFDPLVIGETRVVGRSGKAAYGEFILIPRKAEELKSMSPQSAVSEIRTAARLAKKRGAKILGLGAFTSVVTQGGLALSGGDGPALTTGNSYTVVAARQTVRLAAAKRGWSLPQRAVGILGAGGAVGAALSVLLARDAGRLVLLGNPAHPDASRQRLFEVAGRIVCSLHDLRSELTSLPGSVASRANELDVVQPAKRDRATLIALGEELIRRTDAVAVSVDAAQLLPEVDMVVCCTSSTERMVREELLRPSAVVCDVSRPSNVAADVRAHRPDVMVIDGGVVRMPGGAALSFNASISRGHAYACMAETMMLAMEQRYHDASLGFDLSLEQVLEMDRLAGELGFDVVLEQAGRPAARHDSLGSAAFDDVVDVGSVSV